MFFDSNVFILEDLQILPLDSLPTIIICVIGF